MSEVWTIGKILKWTEEYFQKAQLDSPRLDAEVLLAHVLNRPERIYIYVHFDQPLEQSELAAYRECIKRRVQHEPVAYITGHRDFMGLDFKVTKDTLIPRPDTEILVEAVLQRLPAAGENTTLADIGTGTGAICLSLLNYLPKLRAMAVDISPGALAVAQENSLSLGLSQRVEFFQGDLLAPLKAKGELLNAIFSTLNLYNLLISNTNRQRVSSIRIILHRSCYRDNCCLSNLGRVYLIYFIGQISGCIDCYLT